MRGVISSQITSRPTVFQQLFQTNKKENMNVLHYLPTVTGGFSSQTTSYSECASMSSRHHDVKSLHNVVLQFYVNMIKGKRNWQIFYKGWFWNNSCIMIVQNICTEGQITFTTILLRWNGEKCLDVICLSFCAAIKCQINIARATFIVVHNGYTTLVRRNVIIFRWISCGCTTLVH